MTIELTSFEDRWLDFQGLDRLTNHWWWRPGWRTGRSYYTWHLTFDNDGARPLHELVARLQDALQGAEGLDLIPRRGLHLTMQGLDFTDQVADEHLTAIVTAASERLAAVGTFALTLGPVEADDEATGLLVRPWAAVTQVRTAIRDGIGAVWEEVPEAEAFRPHVSIAYSNSEAPTAPIRERLAPLREVDPVEVPVTSVQLIRLNRDRRMYEWDVVADVPLAQAPAAS